MRAGRRGLSFPEKKEGGPCSLKGKLPRWLVSMHEPTSTIYPLETTTRWHWKSMDVSRPPFSSLPLSYSCLSFSLFLRLSLIYRFVPLVPDSALSHPTFPLSPAHSFSPFPPLVTHCYGYVARYPSHPHLYSIIYKLYSPRFQRNPPKRFFLTKVIRPRWFSSCSINPASLRLTLRSFSRNGQSLTAY